PNKMIDNGIAPLRKPLEKLFALPAPPGPLTEVRVVCAKDALDGVLDDLQLCMQAPCFGSHRLHRSLLFAGRWAGRPADREIERVKLGLKKPVTFLRVNANYR